MFLEKNDVARIIKLSGKADNVAFLAVKILEHNITLVYQQILPKDCNIDLFAKNMPYGHKAFAIFPFSVISAS